MNNETTNPEETKTNLPRRRTRGVKKEIGNLLSVTASEGAKTIEFTLKTASNLVETAYLETIKMPLDSKIDQINELAEDGSITRDDAEKAIKELTAKHTAKLIGDL